MLEDRIKIGSFIDINREVEPVRPYPRINPQQQRPEGYARPPVEKKPDKAEQARRHFTAMRKLIDQLKGTAQIVRVDYNTANQEVCAQGLEIAEEELIDQLLQLKIPLASIDGLIQQLQLQNTELTPTSGRIITASSTLFPVFVEGLSEYGIRFDNLRIKISKQHSRISDEIDKNGRFITEHNRLRLNFKPCGSIPGSTGDPLSLTISIQLGAIEINDTGRRAILYQRPDQNYGLYSDKSINLSI